MSSDDLNSEDILVYFIIGSIIFIIVCIQISNAIRRSVYKRTRCNALNDEWEEFGQVSTIDPNASNFNNFALRDFYIKTAYNCCALGDFKNTYVSTCQLKNVLKQGVRCLDFEIYSVDNKPVIAVSSETSFRVKESYNSLKFSNVLQVIEDHAFSSGNCPNPGDPLILHFRIKSNNSTICDTMAKNIKNILMPTGRILGRDYSYENYGTNLGNVPIKKLMKKIIIIVDKSNDIFKGTELEEYVNLASNSVFMRALRNQDVEFAHNIKELKTYNKKNMTFSMPDLSADDDNNKPLIHTQYGVQMIGMCYQNNDEHLRYYEKFFNKTGHSFVLKPLSLRYVPVLIDCPKKQDPAVSYAPREANLSGVAKIKL